MKMISLMLPKGSHMKKNNNQNLLGQNWPKISPKIAQKWSKIVHFGTIFAHFEGVQGTSDLGGCEWSLGIFLVEYVETSLEVHVGP